VRDYRVLLIYGLGAIGLLMVTVSLAGNILGSVSTGSDITKLTLMNYGKLFADPKLLYVCGQTFLLGGGSVTVMMCFALPFAWLLGRTDFPWKTALFTLLTAELAVPGFITAMAYVWLFNPSSGLVNKLLGTSGLGTATFNVYSLGWICFLQGIVLVPASVFMMLPAFRNMDTSLEEAAWVSGVPKRRAVRGVTLPLLAPTIIAAMMFFFVIAIEIFDFVGLIGMPGGVQVLVLWIYDATHPVVGTPDFGAAGATGFILFLICGAAIALYIRFLRRARRYAVLGGKSRSALPLSLGRWKWLAVGYTCLWCGFAFLVPFVCLIWVALVPFLQTFSIQALHTVNLNGFADALSYIGEPLRNTIVLMVGAITLSIVWSVSISWMVTRGQSSAFKWLDGLVFLAPAVPTMVSAIAFEYFGIAIYRWVPLYGSIWLISIAMAAHMLAYCTRTMNAASLQIHAELDEAAYASSVTPFVAFRRVFLPIMAPAIFYTALMVGMLAARELTLPLMMTPAQSPVVSTLIYNLQTNGDNAAAAAIAIYMIVILVLLGIAARRLSGMGEDGSAALAQRRPRAWRRLMGRSRFAESDIGIEAAAAKPRG
jgi:iron(III) transport system permease protein